MGYAFPRLRKEAAKIMAEAERIREMLREEKEGDARST